MITSPTSRNHQDWSRRYQGTYGWYHKDDGSKVLVYVYRVDGDRVTFHYDDMEFYANVDSGVKFEFIPVNRSWVNGISGNVYLLQRIPHRQWKRGISTDNTSVRLGDMYNARINYGLLSDIFKDGYDPFAKVDVTKRAVALSKNFAINTKNQFMFLDQVVGTVNKNNIILKDDLLFQEVNDMIRRAKYPLTVEVANG